jgi:prolyl-tRNA editing enzyme YbaK/EbsC (Cys-tRNA(Pro) deacylase)
MYNLPPLPATPDLSKFPPTLTERREALPNYTHVTCQRSAASKGIAEHEELKSILFIGEHGFVMAHVPGDRMVDVDALSSEVGPVQLVPRDELPKYGLQKGRVNPFTAEIYLGENHVHVICPMVFQNEKVHTNNDQVGGWIEFDPRQILHWVNRVRVHPISKPK